MFFVGGRSTPSLHVQECNYERLSVSLENGIVMTKISSPSIIMIKSNVGIITITIHHHQMYSV
jgi:hypothetical protein